ncbi:hypothetical protein BC828DRAFT_394562 [Blastocladiella britannica]|nr:hypothetical protein BC828DRAFT_394562 [Blastocladiella britannica]
MSRKRISPPKSANGGPSYSQPTAASTNKARPAHLQNSRSLRTVKRTTRVGKQQPRPARAAGAPAFANLAPAQRKGGQSIKSAVLCEELAKVCSLSSADPSVPRTPSPPPPLPLLTLGPETPVFSPGPTPIICGDISDDEDDPFLLFSGGASDVELLQDVALISLGSPSNSPPDSPYLAAAAGSVVPDLVPMDLPLFPDDDDDNDLAPAPTVAIPLIVTTAGGTDTDGSDSAGIDAGTAGDATGSANATGADAAEPTNDMPPGTNTGADGETSETAETTAEIDSSNTTAETASPATSAATPTLLATSGQARLFCLVAGAFFLGDGDDHEARNAVSRALGIELVRHACFYFCWIALGTPLGISLLTVRAPVH